MFTLRLHYVLFEPDQIPSTALICYQGTIVQLLRILIVSFSRGTKPEKGEPKIAPYKS